MDITMYIWDTFQIAQKKLAQAEGKKQIIEANLAIKRAKEPQGLGPFFVGQWNIYAQNPNSNSHLFGTSQGSGIVILIILENNSKQY